MMTWYVRVKTQRHGHFTACVLADTEDQAREKAIEQVRAKAIGLAWAETEIVEPVPAGLGKKGSEAQ